MHSWTEIGILRTNTFSSALLRISEFLWQKILLILDLKKHFRKVDQKKIIPKLCLSQKPKSLKNGFWGLNFFQANFISEIFLQIWNQHEILDFCAPHIELFFEK
jgi:hypothetical protein